LLPAVHWLSLPHIPGGPPLLLPLWQLPTGAGCRHSASLGRWLTGTSWLPPLELPLDPPLLDPLLEPLLDPLDPPLEPPLELPLEDPDEPPLEPPLELPPSPPASPPTVSVWPPHAQTDVTASPTTSIVPSSRRMSTPHGVRHEQP
jgi:hypothetical protein